jgi:hypothetical protein
MDRLLHSGVYRGHHLSCRGSNGRRARTVEEEICPKERRWIQCRRNIVDLLIGTNSVRILYRKKSPTITHVEPKSGDVRPGIRVIESIVDHEVQQVTPVPRVDRSVSSRAQISFPLSMSKLSLVFVRIDRGFGEVFPESGLEVGGVSEL